MEGEDIGDDEVYALASDSEHLPALRTIIIMILVYAIVIPMII